MKMRFLSVFVLLIVILSGAWLNAAIAELPQESPSSPSSFTYFDDFSSYPLNTVPSGWTEYGTTAITPRVVEFAGQALHFPAYTDQSTSKWLIKDGLTWSTVTASVKLYFRTESDGAGIVLAWVDSNNFIGILPNPYWDEIVVWEFVNGQIQSTHSTGNFAVPIQSHRDYWLKVISKISPSGENQMEVWWSTDGTNYELKVTADNLVNLTGQAGVGTYQFLSNTFFDDFSISDTTPSDCSEQYYAEYYNNQTVSGSPAFIQCENWPIAHDWGYDGPGGGIPNESFSARWTGRATIQEGDYTFIYRSDDGMRVWLNDELIIDNWDNPSLEEGRITRHVSSGEYEIKVEYYENVGAAKAYFRWEQAAPTTCPEQYRAEYYDNQTLSGNPDFVQCENWPINHDWTTNPPAPNIPSGNFSARWTGRATIQEGDYTFIYRSDDGMRVWLDDELIIDNWDNPSLEEGRITRHVSTAEYEIRVEYYNSGGAAVAQFRWELQDTATCPGQYRAEYYNNPTLSGYPTFIQCENWPIDHDWGVNGPGNGLPGDRFSARWTGRATIQEGDYTFIYRSDDGMRVWLNDELIIDNWDNPSLEEGRITRHVSTAEYEIKVEYYENSGGAVAQFRWEQATDTESPVVNWVAPVGNEQTYYVSGEVVQLEVNATDNIGISRVYFYRWDAANEQWVDIGNDYTAPYQMSLDTSGLNYEFNQIFAHAYDAANNASDWKSIWLYRYKETPTPTPTPTATPTSTLPPICGTLIRASYYIGDLTFPLNVLYSDSSGTYYNFPDIGELEIGSSYCFYDPIIGPLNPPIDTVEGYYITEEITDWSRVEPSGTPPRTSTPTPTIGFHPNTHGYKFGNGKGRTSWETFRDTFGAENVEWNIGGSTRRQPFAVAYYNLVYKGTGEKGVCSGMATSSGLLYKEWAQPADFLKSQGVNQAYDLTAPSWEDGLWESGVVADFIVRYQGYQQGQEIRNARRTYNKTLSEMVGDITSSIDNGLADPYTIGVRGEYKDKCAGHALLPYRYERSGNTTTVFVYDSNHAGGTNQKILFNLNTDSWSYYSDIGTWGSGLKCSDINALPLSLWQTRPTPPWPSVRRNGQSPTGEAFQSMTVDGQAHLLIVDNQGRALGYRNGEFVSEIPNARKVIPIEVIPGVTPNYPEMYDVGTDLAFTMNVVYTDTGQAVVNYFGEGGMIEVEGAASNSNATDTIQVAEDAKEVSVTAGSLASGRAMTILNASTSWGNEVNVGDFKLDGGGIATMALESGRLNSQQVTFTSSSASDGYRLKMRQTTTTGTSLFVATGITFDAGDTHSLTMDWSDVSTAILQIDHGSNGTIDETQELDNELEQIYLPLLTR